ncbi:hypothetical protein CHARACLAT_022551 [Characodon lateralis]|uniref:Uncharacterized protein n=1 Tax=Characodon lateralis TaxID=208331 RepID=A0ABU7F581_9TELE|nr:hypothetical protein [Characodon lateralis]
MRKLFYQPQKHLIRSYLETRHSRMNAWIQMGLPERRGSWPRSRLHCTRSAGKGREFSCGVFHRQSMCGISR